MSTTDAIVIDNLTKSFGKVHVLKGVNLRVRCGTMLALLGPNGAGKTTIIRILSTLIPPDSGTVMIEGHNVVKEAHAVRSIIGLTGQYAAVDELLTARENLLMMGRLYHLSPEVSKRRCEELLKQFDLVEASDRQVKNFSGGMQRRLDLALSLVATPPIIFLDEPTTGLDPRSRLAMWAVIKDLMRNGATIVLTTQYLEEADQLADRIAVIDHGKIIAEGTADELKAKVGKERFEIVFKDQKDLDRAAQAVNSSAHKNTEDLILTVPTEGVGDIKKILDKVEQSGAKIESLSLHKPSLDDVFLKLTGREVEHVQEGTEQK